MDEYASKAAELAHRVLHQASDVVGDSKTAEERGIFDAKAELERRGVDLTQDGGRGFALAVRDMIVHREVGGGLDFSESSLDVARVITTAWALDRLVNDEIGSVGIPTATAAAQTIMAESGTYLSEADIGHLVDRTVASYARDAALARASVSFEMFGRELMNEKAERPSDEQLGIAAISVGLMLPPHEVRNTMSEADADMWSQIEARRLYLHAQSFDAGAKGYEGLAGFRVLGNLDVDRAAGAATVASRPFVVDPSPIGDGLVIAERYHVEKAGRPLREYEQRMVEMAMARVGYLPEVADIDARDAARIMLVDSAVQMSAWQVTAEQSFGLSRILPRMHFDDVVDASAGMDLHASGVSPSRDVTMEVAFGRFDRIADERVAESIADGLKAAQKPISNRIEMDLVRIEAGLRAERAAEVDLLSTGKMSLEDRRSPAKGPEAPELPQIQRAGNER